MHIQSRFHLLPCALLLLIPLLGLGAEPKANKLIEFGWDEPDPGFMREHIAEMERAPFDGVVFHAEARKAKGGKANFTWAGWGTNRFEEAELREAIEDLRATKFRRFTDNFFRFNTTPGKLDWFDDHATVIHNCRVAASFARQNARPGQDVEVARDRREPNRARLRDLADVAHRPVLGEAPQDGEARRITQRLEEVGREQVAEPPPCG